MSRRSSVAEPACRQLGRRANGWWGMLTLIATEAALFAFLLFSYYTAVQHGRTGFPTASRLAMARPNTILLLASSLSRGRASAILGGEPPEGGAVVCASDHGRGSSLRSGCRSGKGASRRAVLWSLYFIITGFHMAHVVVGVADPDGSRPLDGAWLLRSAAHALVSIGAIYWHFVDVVWLAVFFTFYISPRLEVG